MYQQKLADITEKQHEITEQLSLLTDETIGSSGDVERYQRPLEHIDAVLRESERLNPVTNAATGLKHYIVEHRLTERIREVSEYKITRRKALELAKNLGDRYPLIEISRMANPEEKKGIRFLKSLVMKGT